MAEPKIGNRVAAFHEAGHAVAAVVLDVPFERVSIRSDDPSLGQAVFAGVPLSPDWYLEGDREARDAVENRIVVVLAGPEAERFTRNEYGPAVLGAVADSELVRLALEPLGAELGLEGVRNYQAYIRDRARLLVNGLLNRRAIEAVAAALLERHTLTAADVARVVSDGARRIGP